MYEWRPGTNANGTIDDLERAAVDLAAFAMALRQVDTTGVASNPDTALITLPRWTTYVAATKVARWS
ncbi:hypothetical protein BH20ACT4_BH20ACT4_14840 [soil metagenome]